MNKNLFIIIGTCLIFIAFISCKKSKGSSVQHDDITGKWRKTRIAIDTNGNGVMDTSEFMSVSSYDSTHVLVFNSDGSGQITYMNTSAGTFSWSLANNNTTLTISAGGGTTSQHIDLLTSSAMILKDTTGISLVWNMFTKQ